MISEKIKKLRENSGITQAELARQLGVTRSGVNAWEMGITSPSTQCLVELALFFKVSADYLLDLDDSASINVSGLTSEDILILHSLADFLRKKNRSQ